MSCNFEAEDRAYFPKSKTSEFVPATRKAIVGIIVPDSEYYSEAVTKVTEKYPDLPVYAYRDPVNKLPKGEKHGSRGRGSLDSPYRIQLLEFGRSRIYGC